MKRKKEKEKKSFLIDHFLWLSISVGISSARSPQDKLSVLEPSFHSIRDWELTQCGRQYLRKPKSQQGFDFRVMSYNVLAQRLLEDNSYLYRDCDNNVLKWKNRKRGLMAELRYHRPDVCMLFLTCLTLSSCCYPF